MFHLTHENCDSMMERHLRYLRAEAIDGKNESFFDSFKVVLREIFKVVFGKRLISLDGMELCFHLHICHIL